MTGSLEKWSTSVNKKMTFPLKSFYHVQNVCPILALKDDFRGRDRVVVAVREQPTGATKARRVEIDGAHDFFAKLY